VPKKMHCIRKLSRITLIQAKLFELT